MRLAGKVSLVTGAQQGIGKAIALAFGHEGCSVVINYLDDKDSAEEIAGRVHSFGSGASIVPGSVTRKRDVKRMVETGRELGGIDILVNNAAIFPRTEFLKMRESDWDDVLDVNLKSTFFCTQAVARQWVADGRRGVIVNIASIAAFRSSPKGAHYVSSKAGVIGLTRAVALELAPYGIRVNVIAPGITDTAQPRYGMSEAEIQEVGRQVPLGGIASPEDVADLAVFLCSGEARHITGQTIHVNGGQYLY